MKFESHKASTMLTVWKCPYCGQTFAVGDDKELLEDGSTREMPLIYSIEPIYCPLCGKALNERGTNMAVNTDKELWESIAKHFDVELDEWFLLKETADATIQIPSKAIFSLTVEGLKSRRMTEDSSKIAMIERGLLCGKYLILKLPWKPSNGDLFYYIVLGEKLQIYRDMWASSTKDEMLYKIHNCFRTEEEVMAKADRLLEVLNNEE